MIFYFAGSKAQTKHNNQGEKEVQLQQRTVSYLADPSLLRWALT